MHYRGGSRVDERRGSPASARSARARPGDARIRHYPRRERVRGNLVLRPRRPPGRLVHRAAELPRRAARVGDVRLRPAERANVGLRSREWTAVAQSEEAVVAEMARPQGAGTGTGAEVADPRGRTASVESPRNGPRPTTHAAIRNPFRTTTDGVSCRGARTLQPATVSGRADARAHPERR
jgi:hypothetical protein